MVHPFFDEIRNPNCRFPDSRNNTGNMKELPALFDFNRHGKRLHYHVRDLNLTRITELSIAPALNAKLVPPHAKELLASQGLDIDNLVPMSKEEMQARLD